MTRLPLELLQAVVQGVDGPMDLINVRLVSKDLSSLVTPLAFHAIVVNDSLKSAKAVSFLQDHESLASLVREVVFRGDPESSLEAGYARETSGEPGRDALRNVFSELTKFCNLQKLRFDFHGTYEEDELSYNDAPTHYFLLQNEIFATLALNPPPVVSLTLNNVIAKPDDIYTQERFHQIFRSLQELSISVLSDVGLEGGHGNEDLGAFWEENIMHMVYSATAITTLAISSDQPVGSQPATSFENIDLPHLSSLVLHNFAFQPSTDIVEFILRHKDTLTRLELHKCSIDGGWHDASPPDEGFDEVFPCPWHAIFASFEEELGNLREFVFESDSEPRFSEPRFKYTRDDKGLGYVLWEEAAEAVGELDGPALESLMAAVNSRRGVKGQSDDNAGHGDVDSDDNE